jgi:6-pyruvoyltetrahydropterin/6-carboxytetrahydropterin synthase
MLTSLWVRQEFDAAHSLAGTFPRGHQCARLHGHRYAVTLTVSARVCGDILVDYHEMHDGLAEILKRYDHRLLNDVMKNPPTCENLALEIMREAKKKWGSVASVEVQEQTNTGCRVDA